jgi:small-conductance mechanosensitive channel
MTKRHNDGTGDLVPKVGIWRSVAHLGNYKLKDLLWPEGLPAIAIGIGGALAIVSATELSDRIAFMTTIAQLAAAFLAVVFTALVIMVALPSGSYLSALQKDDPWSNGMKDFLSPFLIAVGTQIAILLLAIGYGLAAQGVSESVEHIAFCVLGFLLVYGLLDIAALARSLVRHGILRARDAVREAEEDKKVHSLPGRRSG